MFLKTNDNKGFTLSEMVIAVVIVGVLASLALPRFGRVFERVKASEGAHILTALLRAQKAYRIEFGAYSPVAASLDVEIDRSANFNTGSIVVANNAANVAQIQRNGLEYTLSIDEDGTISCTDGTTITCAEVGY